MIAVIQAALPEASIRTICATLGVSRSWWYATRAQPPNETEQELVDRIEQIILRYPGYGYRRVTIALQQQGVVINHKRVRRLMRHHALLCQVTRAVATTHSQHPFRRVPNLIRDLAVTGPGQLWVADLTYLHLVRETAFLACVLDAWSRRCIGWALGTDLTAALSLAALEQAIRTQPPQPGLIHHSDQGVQYANHRYAARLRQIGARQSMSAVGRPTDNARIEAFFSTLKREEVWLTDYQTMAEARHHLHRYIDQIYNTERLHSSLGYQPPASYEATTR